MRIVSAVILMLATLSAAQAESLGLTVENILKDRSLSLFGIKAPLAGSAAASPTSGYRKPDDTPSDVIMLASGLKAEFVTREAGNALDMMQLFPKSSPTHIIACNETPRAKIGKKNDGSDKYNPSVQRISLSTGAVTTILRGMDRCDGVRVTPWGTIIVNEETADGKVYELLKPLKTREATVLDRATGAVSTSQIKIYLNMPHMAWEGFAITRDGVVYGGDELRPGTGTADKDGGAIYKFVPKTKWDGKPISSLANSPLNSGTSYALRVSCQQSTVQYGQGCEVGLGDWVQIDPLLARSDAAAKGATGNYRPEDLHLDPFYTGAGIRACVAITDNVEAGQYGQVLCFTDSKPLRVYQPDDKGQIVHQVEVRRHILGDKSFNSFDNLEFQGASGNLHVVEDFPNGEIFSCLRDGPDRDLMSDGCVKWLAVKDSSAEPTGIIFNSTGKVAYVSVSHSDDKNMRPVDGFGTDDLLKITGFKP